MRLSENESGLMRRNNWKNIYFENHESSSDESIYSVYFNEEKRRDAPSTCFARGEIFMEGRFAWDRHCQALLFWGNLGFAKTILQRTERAFFVCGTLSLI
jgi:hypothetical protein